MQIVNTRVVVGTGKAEANRLVPEIHIVFVTYLFYQELRHHDLVRPGVVILGLPLYALGRVLELRAVVNVVVEGSEHAEDIPTVVPHFAALA